MKKTLQFIALIILAFGLVACGTQNTTNTANTASTSNSTGGSEAPAEAQTGLDAIKEKGKIVLGTSAEFPPYEWHNIEGGKDEIIGVDIEIGKAIAEHLGVELEIKDMSFDGLLAGLNVGEMDMVIAGLAATEERAKSVDFSQPYYSGKEALLVREEDKDKYKTQDDLAGLTIGVQLGTYPETYANEHFNADIKALQDNNNIVMELQNKTFDAVFMDMDVCEKFASLQEGLAVIDIGAEGDEGTSVAVKKGNTELLKEIDAVVADLKSKDQVKTWIQEFSDYAGE
ncbi:transporter substrate-binding domain-containing protein [Peptoniphilus equinus]|uniref:Transporter substrate-binding domain-containing protein n=1 Tax=Peptoniphilus equinus TaxID=3016343 RepID=A0ABY7QTN8_9FIRM|nr:transporter substrate-binding domain-containing protein [Peptoniphilus equinus]WBW50097.1 transporter substrate-binding domain-containing protein [Peptoniphilus equinus]